MDNPHRYSTKEWDEKSGLYYFGFRYYSPEIGRWTQRDPSGVLDGLNLYNYVRCMPSILIDPWGLRRREPTLQERMKLVRALALLLRSCCPGLRELYLEVSRWVASALIDDELKYPVQAETTKPLHVRLVGQAEALDR